MLDGLEHIDWHALSHAYGEADDVPGLLRDILSSDDERREQALTMLSLSLCHQGTVYSASAHAVPFLVALLTNDAAQDKAYFLLLLACMAQGDAYHRQHLDYFSEDTQQDPAFQNKLAEEVDWAEKTRQTVHQSMSLYLELLSHPDREMRMNAAYILAQFPEDASSIAPFLRSQIAREGDYQAKASMLLNLGALGEAVPENRFLLTTALQEEEAQEGNALIRLAAATASVWLGSTEVPQEAITILVEILSSPKSPALFEAYAALPWVEGSLAFFAGCALQRLPPEHLQDFLPQLAHAIEIVDYYDVEVVIQTLLYIAFGNRPLPEPVTAEHLSEQQHWVLSVLAQSTAVWHPASGLYARRSTLLPALSRYVEEPESVVVINDDLQALGLPDRQQDLQDFLNMLS